MSERQCQEGDNRPWRYSFGFLLCQERDKRQTQPRRISDLASHARRLPSGYFQKSLPKTKMLLLCSPRDVNFSDCGVFDV